MCGGAGVIPSFFPRDPPPPWGEISVFFEQGRISINQEGLQLFYEERTEQDYYPGFFRLKDKTTKIRVKDDFDLSMTYALDNLIDSFKIRELLIVI